MGTSGSKNTKLEEEKSKKQQHQNGIAGHSNADHVSPTFAGVNGLASASQSSPRRAFVEERRNTATPVDDEKLDATDDDDETVRVFPTNRRRNDAGLPRSMSALRSRELEDKTGVAPTENQSNVVFENGAVLYDIAGRPMSALRRPDHVGFLGLCQVGGAVISENGVGGAGRTKRVRFSDVVSEVGAPISGVADPTLTTSTMTAPKANRTISSGSLTPLWETDAATTTPPVANGAPNRRDGTGSRKTPSQGATPRDSAPEVGDILRKTVRYSRHYMGDPK